MLTSADRILENLESTPDTPEACGILNKSLQAADELTKQIAVNGIPDDVEIANDLNKRTKSLLADSLDDPTANAAKKELLEEHLDLIQATLKKPALRNIDDLLDTLLGKAEQLTRAVAETMGK